MEHEKQEQAVATGGLDEFDLIVKEFMTKYNNPAEKWRRDVPVKVLRHIIPAFVVQCFAVRDNLATRKVRGLWDKPPSSWDPRVPFLDPNNKGDQGKPKKEVLVQMFQYLMKMYQGNGDTALDLSKGPTPKSEMLTESEDTDEGRPVEVADDTDNYDWNPLEDCKQRIVAKLRSMQGKKHLSRGEIGVLNMGKDLLFQLFDLRSEMKSLAYAHDFELTLDIVRVTRKLPAEYTIKWRKFIGERSVLLASCPLKT